jgi:hypothetical protein
MEAMIPTTRNGSATSSRFSTVVRTAKSSSTTMNTSSRLLDGHSLIVPDHVRAALGSAVVTPREQATACRHMPLPLTSH